MRPIRLWNSIRTFSIGLVRTGPPARLIKSASYLLHDAQFSKTRAMVLDSADVLVQDDTGIPYRFINQSPWQVKLYGKYQ